MIFHDLSLAVSKDTVLKAGNWMSLFFCAKLPLLTQRKYRGIKTTKKKKKKTEERKIIYAYTS